MRRLPPMSTLRSFEAAARLLSFSKAADELHVTHGAVSRSIATLEDALQLKLFERGVRTVRLTQAGRVLLRRGEGCSRQAFGHHHPAHGPAVQRRAERFDTRFLCRQMACAAHVSLFGRQSRYRHPAVDIGTACQLRGGRHRPVHPLWPRQLSGADSSELLAEGGVDAGVQPRPVEARVHRCNSCRTCATIP